MIVTITSWAPVRAFSQPTMPPQSRRRQPGEQATSRWSTGGRCQVKPTYAAKIAPEDRLALGADVEQAGPERQPDTEPGADQRGRLSGGLGDRPVPTRRRR